MEHTTICLVLNLPSALTTGRCVSITVYSCRTLPCFLQSAFRNFSSSVPLRPDFNRLPVLLLKTANMLEFSMIYFLTFLICYVTPTLTAAGAKSAEGNSKIIYKSFWLIVRPSVTAFRFWMPCEVEDFRFALVIGSFGLGIYFAVFGAKFAHAGIKLIFHHTNAPEILAEQPNRLRAQEILLRLFPRWSW